MTNNFLQNILYVLLIASIVICYYMVVEGLKANAGREVQRRVDSQCSIYKGLAMMYCEQKCLEGTVCYNECLMGNLIDAE